MISAPSPVLDSRRRSDPDRHSAVGVAQLVELLVVVQAVAGSSPVAHPPRNPCHRQGSGVLLPSRRSAELGTDWGHSLSSFGFRCAKSRTLERADRGAQPGEAPFIAASQASPRVSPWTALAGGAVDPLILWGAGRNFWLVGPPPKRKAVLMALRLCVLVALLAVVALLPAGTAGAHRDRSPEVVASGLDNPRGLDVTPWGTVMWLTRPWRKRPLPDQRRSRDQLRRRERRRDQDPAARRPVPRRGGVPSPASPTGDEAIGPSDTHCDGGAGPT